MMGTGVALVVASVPMFVCSRINRKKALRLSAGMSNVQESLPCGSVSSLPAVGVRLSF